MTQPAPSGGDRGSRLGVAAAAAAALGVAAAVGLLVWALGRDGGAPTVSSTAPPAPPPAPAPAAVPPLPGFGEFPGSPPDFAVPQGGAAEVDRVPGGREIVLTRDDGTPFAEAEVDGRGEYQEITYFDARGRERLTVSRVDTAPRGRPARAAAAAGGCRDLRADAGWRWAAFPLRWRFNARSVPRGVGASRALRAARLARSAWIRNTNRCGVRDLSAVRFAYRGATTAGLGRNGVNTIGFGEIDALGGPCVRALACTFTWRGGDGGVAIESDIRIDRNPPAGVSAAASPGRRVDLQSVFTHETGHTLGLNHVGGGGNVMNAAIIAGTTVFRKLGLGDARANNAKY